jgi:hypothetical protein
MYKHLNRFSACFGCRLAVLVLLSWIQPLCAQDQKQAVIQLAFLSTDSTRTCRATVTAATRPVAGVDVHLYVKRMYSLLPIGKTGTTDSAGVADIDVPANLPGDANRDLQLVAKVENDANYGNAETQASVRWGVSKPDKLPHQNDRSLSASRDKAPMFLVVVSILIIAIIWGTVLFVVTQLFRIRRAGLLSHKPN